MISSSQLESYIEQLLMCNQFSDYAPNGIQVQGQHSIHSICTAVTASLAAIEQAIDLNAQALLVHHGYFWKNEDSRIIGIKRQRIKRLLEQNITLFAYHLPLDCHLLLGNNAQIASRLLVQDIQQHDIAGVKNLLWSGRLKNSVSAADFNVLLARCFNRMPVHLAGSSKLIKRVAWCTGAAQDYLSQASELEVDAYISGEVCERTYHEALELGIHYFACGHHVTERYGIQALGEQLKLEFNLEHTYIELENPI